MKVKLTESKSKTTGLQFPWLGISTSGNVILFFDAGNGVLLKDGENCSGLVGEPLTSWRADLCKPYTGQVTLENS